MPLQHNPDVGTGGDGLGASALAGTGGFGLSIHASPFPGTGGDGLCGDGGGGGGGEGEFFTIAEPTAVCIGDSVELIIDIVPSSGFLTGSVSLSAEDLPTGMTASFDPNPVTITDGEATTSTLTLTAGGSTAEGSHTITVIGQNADTIVELEINITVENCDVAAVRFIMDEAAWPPTTDMYQFKIQNLGSSDLYRLQSEVAVEGCTSLTTMGYRLSPDGTKLAAWYELDMGGGSTKDLVRVYDLGATLSHSGLWGDFDGEPQPDVYILDADLLHQVLEDIDADHRWADVNVGNDGEIYILADDLVPDAVQEEMIWSFAGFGETPFDLGFPETTGQITVVADPRATADTSQATFTVTKCCQSCSGSSDALTVATNPNEAWWSSNGPDGGACLPVAPGLFCRDSFLQVPYDVTCLGTSRAEASITLTFDKSGLLAGTYTDEAADLITYGGTTCSLCAVLSAPNGDFQAQTMTGAPSVIRFVIEVPVRHQATLYKKEVAGVLTQQSQATFENNIVELLGPAVIPYQVCHILDPVNNLVTVEFDTTEAGNLMAVVDLSLDGKVVFSEFPISIIEATGDMMAVMRPGPNNLMWWPGTDNVNTPQTFYSVLTQVRAGVLKNIYATNTRSNLHPELEDDQGSVVNASMFCVLLTDTTGYVIGPRVYDSEVRRVEIDLDTSELTVAALPTDVVCSPGHTFPSRIRGMEPYDAFSAEWGPRADLWAVGIVSG